MSWKELFIVNLILAAYMCYPILKNHNEQKERERQEFMADVESAYSIIADWEKECNKKIDKPTELYKVANLGNKLSAHMSKFLVTHDEICSFEN